MSSHLIIETACSQIEAEISKLNQLLIRGLPDSLLGICNKLLDYLNAELSVSKWEDKYDIQELHKDLSVIGYITRLFSDAAKDRSSWWAEALVKECYDKLDISLKEREIVLVHSDEVTDFMVWPDVLDILPRRININISKKIDVFWIPLESRHDIASISLVAHEVGHVYFQQNKKELIKNITIDFKKIQLDLFGEIENKLNKITSHVEEYFCDAIGRYIIGVAFDIALIKLLLPNAVSTKGSKTHPPESKRVLLSLELLQNAKSSISSSQTNGLKVALEKIVNGWEEIIVFDSKETLDTDDHYAFELFEKLYNEFSQNKTDLIISKLTDIWDLVVPELSRFRPPIERVDNNQPISISAIEAIIGTSVYYYGEHFREKSGNDFYENSKQEETEKFRILRKRIIEHLIYAVSIRDFVKHAQSKLKKADFSGDKLGKSPLWQLRVSTTGGITNPLVVVPSIDPAQQYGDNSIDLRLGSSFLVHQPSRYTHLEPNPSKNINNQDYITSIGSFYSELNIPIGNEFILHPHQFVLAGVLEYICLPFNYYALVLGRSTWGRLGLNIATATTVQAGYRGCLTLELRNLGETPLPLTVGSRIAQLCIINVPKDGTEKGYFASGAKYIGPVKPQIPLINNDKDWDLLNLVAK